MVAMPVLRAKTGGWISTVLNAELLIERGEFRLRDLEAPEPIPDFNALTRLHAEAEQARFEAERRIAELEAALRDRRR